jgi:hypothetical protein
MKFEEAMSNNPSKERHCKFCGFKLSAAEIKAQYCDSCDRSQKLEETIVGHAGNYKVISKTGKNLGGGRSYKKALKRLRQVEYFKHHS